MIDGIAEYKERQQNTRLCKIKLSAYMATHGIPRGPCTIHGKDGPVYWENIREHPKVRRRDGFARGYIRPTQ